MGAQKYKPQAGDRVRVVTEGVVTRAGETDYFRIGDSEIWASDAAVVSIEKIEPPVEVFGPGDIVRSKQYGNVYAIREGGKWLMIERHDSKYGPGYESKSSSRFTSEDYERVVLS